MFKIEYVVIDGQFFNNVREFCTRNNYFIAESDLIVCQADTLCVNDCRGVIARDSKGDIVAINLYCWEYANNMPAIFTPSLGCINFASTLSIEDIDTIIKQAAVPIEWLVNNGHPNSFHDAYMHGMYMFELPDSVNGYLESLDKKHRTEYRKYIKTDVRFEQVRSEDILKDTSLSELQNAYSAQISSGSAIPQLRVKALFESADCLEFRKVYVDDKYVGVNISEVSNHLDKQVFTDIMFICLDRDGYQGSGWYFSIIYHLITQLIQDGQVNVYNPMLGITVKKKFCPKLHNTEKYSVMGLSNYEEGSPPPNEVYVPEYFNAHIYKDVNNDNQYVVIDADEVIGTFIPCGSIALRFKGTPVAKSHVMDFMKTVYGKHLTPEDVFGEVQ